MLDGEKGEQNRCGEYGFIFMHCILEATKPAENLRRACLMVRKGCKRKKEHIFATLITWRRIIVEWRSPKPTKASSWCQDIMMFLRFEKKKSNIFLKDQLKVIGLSNCLFWLTYSSPLSVSYNMVYLAELAVQWWHSMQNGLIVFLSNIVHILHLLCP